MPSRGVRRGTVARSRWSKIVREGWNRVSYRYRPRGSPSDSFDHTIDDYRAWLAPILDALPTGSAVLDLGSGTGVPAARILARRFQVTGVDLSDTQVRRARRLVPNARFVRADFTEIDFPPASFSAVISLYALIHVPREQHRDILRKVARWLVPGGWFLVMVGHSRYEGLEPRWLGSNRPMLWSHYGAATYRRWFLEGGYRIQRETFVPEGDGGHQLFLVRSRRLRRTAG